MKRVTAAEANRSFSRLLKEAQHGTTIVVTSHGRPVIKIEAYSESSAEDAEAGARRRALVESHHRQLLERPVLNLGKFDRAWAYDE
jgi:prevent-host-death family protein